MDNYELSLESTNDNDIPIAHIKDKIISLHKVKGAPTINHTQIIDKSNKIEPIPYIHENQNIRYFISGQSGCGKSTLVKLILHNYLKLYPKQDVILVSSLDEDPIFDKDPILSKKIKRVDINDLDELEAKDFNNAIVIFDDASSSNMKIKKNIDALQDEINRKGRHFQTDIINVVDKLLGGASTERKFLHATYLCYFVHTGGNKAAVKYMLKEKLGMEKEQIQICLNGTSRWSILHKQYPNYIVETNRVKLI